MKRYLWLIWLLPLALQGQIYEEEFDPGFQTYGVIGGCTTDNPLTCLFYNTTGVDWDLSASYSEMTDFNSSVITAGGELEFKNTRTEVCWNSPVIDVSTARSLDFALRLTEIGDLDENITLPERTDYIDVYYTVGNTETQIINYNGQGNSFHTLIGGEGSNDADFGTAFISEGSIDVDGETDFYITVCVYLFYTGADEVVLLDDVVVDILLPVSLTTFTSNQEGKSIVLDWVTASESNNSHFILERSTNSSEFHPLGEVEGAGTSTSANTYQYIDENTFARCKLLSTTPS